eukprot:6264396-Prymnesium_polylepis.1
MPGRARQERAGGQLRGHAELCRLVRGRSSRDLHLGLLGALPGGRGAVDRAGDRGGGGGLLDHLLHARALPRRRGSRPGRLDGRSVPRRRARAAVEARRLPERDQLGVVGHDGAGGGGGVGGVRQRRQLPGLPRRLRLAPRAGCGARSWLSARVSVLARGRRTHGGRAGGAAQDGAWQRRRREPGAAGPQVDRCARRRRHRWTRRRARRRARAVAFGRRGCRSLGAADDRSLAVAAAADGAALAR